MQNAGIRHAVEQRRNVAYTADRLQFFVPIQLRNQSNRVDGSRRLGQLQHSRIDPTVGIKRKIPHLEVLYGFVERGVIEQDGAQNGTFSVRV